VPTESDYVTAPGPLTFTVQGFTNPATSEEAYFSFSTYSVIDG